MTIDVLKSVGFRTSMNAVLDGLVPIDQPLGELAPDEAAVVRQAAVFEHVDFVFFRRFSDSRSSIVCAYVVDNDKHKLPDEELATLHNVLWLHGVAPLVYVTTTTRIDILSCARGPDFWDERQQARIFKPAERLQIASEVERELKKLRRFQAQRLADGTFWDDAKNAKLANNKKSAHEALIQAIVDVDTELDGNNQPMMRRLLLLMVLIKYLEDRKVFPNPGWFGTYCKGARSFFDVLKAGNPDSVLRLLANLEKRFNGDVFVLPDGTSRSLTESALRNFAKLVEAKTLKQQRYLWELYSFEHIPVEIISHLYNRFLTGKDQVYTPPFLASLLLDYVMPYAQLTGKERVLDPACGSGIFLVGAFRRLVNVWRARHQWKEPDAKTLKKLLLRSIFGVEHSPTAVDLTAFSLALAVCDALRPNVIWRDLQFERLRAGNILEEDFFDCIPGNEPTVEDREEKPLIKLGQFDIIVGNPPFESTLTPAGARLNNKLTKERGKLPDTNAAYLFLEQALKLLSPEGRGCLLQPHGFLYNQNTRDFRKHVFHQSAVEFVLDFVSIRHLFDGADPKSVAVQIRNGKPEEHARITHLTFRRTYLAHQRLGFELDCYDEHFVAQEYAEAEPLLWRINLLGGGRLWSIYKRLSESRTLREFVESKNWLLAEGFIVGNKKRKATYITGHPFLPTSGLTGTGIDESQIHTCEETDFEGPRAEELYSPPLVLIGEHVSLPIAYWEKSRLTFKNEIVGISTRGRQDSDLPLMFERLSEQRELLKFFAMLVSSRGLLTRATALYKSDIADLPYPSKRSDLALGFWEDAIQSDTLEYMADYVRLGQNSSLLKNLAEESMVSQYSELYQRMLGSVYSNLSASEPVFFDGVICQPFFFGAKPELDWLNSDCVDQLRDLVYANYGTVLRTKRVVRFYDQNVIFVVKPDRLRYWIRSTAIRDADDTLIDLQEQGY